MFVSIFNKVKGGDNCCGSLHKPLVFPSVPLHFPYSGLWELLLCSLSILAICFLRKLSYFCKFTLINLTCSNISLEPFRKPCCLFNMQLELGPSFTRCSSASLRMTRAEEDTFPPSGIKMINRRGSRPARDMEMWVRLLYRSASWGTFSPRLTPRKQLLDILAANNGSLCFRQWSQRGFSCVDPVL